MKRIFLTLLALILLAACKPAASSPDAPVDSGSSPNGSQPSYAPRPGDERLTRGNAFDLTAELLAAESFPVQYFLLLKGSLPTPCHELRVVVHEPDAGNKINVDVYSVTDPDKMCVEVIQPFERNIPLGSFPAGHYTVRVNGETMAGFDA